MSTLNTIELFCGAGGLSEGFEREDFTILTGIDVWDDAVKTYRKNHETVGLVEDLSEMDPEEIPVDKTHVNGVVGGPPCKGFSLAGLRDPDDERNELVADFLDAVEYLEPEFVVMENVVGILSMEDGDVVEYIIDRLEDMGLNADYQKLTATDYGIPQTRTRVFFIGHRTETPQFPEPTTEDETQAVKTVLEKDFDNMSNHTLTNHSDDVIDRISDLEYGESLYDSYQEAWKRLNPEKPAPTIKENHNAPFIHYSEDRVGTPRECAEIQTFPSDYEFIGSKSSVLKQIGNAVPPRLAQMVAKEVRKLSA